MSSYKEALYSKGEKHTTDVFVVCGQRIIVEGRLIRMAHLKDEYETEICDPESFIKEVHNSGCRADIFTFWDRVPTHTSHPYLCQKQTQALLPVDSYELWWKSLDRRIRKIVRRSIKLGVEVRVVGLDDELLRGIKKIFDETPIKRNRPFWHYNRSIEDLRAALEQDLQTSEFIVAFYRGECIGFIKMIYRDKFADPVLFISKMEHLDKCPNNLLIARAVERCEAKNLPFIHYSDWRLGTHGDFLRRNGFKKFDVNRYYVPLTMRGKILLCLGAHKRVWDRLPEKVKIAILGARGRWYRLVFWLTGKNGEPEPSSAANE